MAGSLPTSGRNFAPILNFTPMDTVMTHIIAQFRAEGELVARLFPPEQGVLLAWADMVLRELVSLPCGGIINLMC